MRSQGIKQHELSVMFVTSSRTNFDYFRIDFVKIFCYYMIEENIKFSDVKSKKQSNKIFQALTIQKI
jgi:ABC-type molybdate transport system ATPase subunit